MILTDHAASVAASGVKASSNSTGELADHLADGTSLGDIRYTLETDGRDLLYVPTRGMRHGSAEVLARLGRGEEVDASEYTLPNLDADRDRRSGP